MGYIRHKDGSRTAAPCVHYGHGAASRSATLLLLLSPEPDGECHPSEAAVGLSFLLTALFCPAAPLFTVFDYYMSMDAVRELFLVDEAPGQSHGV